MKNLAAGFLVIATAIAAGIAPVWTYAISLALFGLPHVLVELRYVDERFAARIPRNFVMGLAICLYGIVLMRAFALVDVGSSDERITAELLFGICLIVTALPMLRRTRISPIAIATATSLLLGILYAPITTLVAMALLHNLTPVGFLAERLQGRERRRAMLYCLIIFVLIPLVLLLAPTSMFMMEGPLSVGHLDDHLSSFVPPALLGTSMADRLFAAAAYLQCMHYAVVLHVLPKLSGGDQTADATVPWPRQSIFLTTVSCLGIMMTIGFVANFREARATYSMFAAVHAWIEIPVLLIAFSVLPKLISKETKLA